MEKLYKIRQDFENNVILGYLNVNSIRNKHNDLFSLVGNNFDILCIAETKIDSSFPKRQFEVKGYKSPFRLDVSDKSGGLLVYAKEALSSSRPKGFTLPKDIQVIPLEIRLKSCKWLVISIYRPPKQDLGYFLTWLSKLLDFYSSERCIVLGDFNTEPADSNLSNFIDSHEFHNHVKFKTCFKSPNGTCIDLILSNKRHGLQLTGSLDTGISDFHRLVYTVLKSTFIKLPPKEILYRNFKHFSETDFLTELSNKLCSFPREMIVCNYDFFEFVFSSVLDKHAPWKKKFIRGNEKPHMNKALKKAIMKRSKLWNIYCKSKHLPDLLAYKEQRNFVTKLNKKTKKLFFETALKDVNNSPKTFWNLCKPFMTDKGPSKSQIVLQKFDGSLIQDETKVSLIMNSHFNNVTKPLNLFKWNRDFCSSGKNPVLDAIKKYENHPSILKIRSKSKSSQEFHFKKVTEKQVYEIISKLDSSKKTGGPISNKILKSSVNVICPYITEIINLSIQNCTFPDKLKLAEITPVPKTADSQCIWDFRPISILPAISKIFEKVLCNQLTAYFETLFCNLLCGFRKGHSTQDALLQLLRSWQKRLDEGNIVGTILMDLSKAFDCLPHDLIIAKCAAYGVDFKSLSLLSDYLSNRYHRVKIGCRFSDWLLFIIGVPQGSILGPLLFNIFLNDIFLFLQEASICNFADDNSLYVHARSLVEVIQTLEAETINVLEWFKFNSIAANPAKFQLMFLGNFGDNCDIKVRVDNTILRPKSCVKLLGLIIDSKLSFSEHVQTLCKSASAKVKALFRIRPYLNLISAKRLCEAFVLSSFNYCPLIWMYGCKSNHTLINFQFRALQAVYFNFSSSFTELLERDASVSIHVKNLRYLLIEIYKIIHRESPSFLWDMFVTKSSPYSLRSGGSLKLPPTKTQKFGTRSITFRGSLLWGSLPHSLKSAESLKLFKTQIKSWSGEACTCHICS